MTTSSDSYLSLQGNIICLLLALTGGHYRAPGLSSAAFRKRTAR